jgi:catechol 2,3-dioxygenase-like lactoylglutathione lyase family enzyme
MNIEHIATTITDQAEIQNFYCNVLGMNEIRRFVLKNELAGQIFGINKDTFVFQLQKEDLFLELFLVAGKYDKGFEHICISIKDRENLIAKAEQNGYTCIRIEKEKSDLVFIKDKSGNIFEIKESNANTKK